MASAAQTLMQAIRNDSASAVPLLSAMMNPNETKTDVAPDIGVTGANAFIAPVTTSLTYQVFAEPGSRTSDLLPFYTDTVPYQTGMYISFPQESIESTYHYGFVRGGSQFLVGYAGYAFYPNQAIARGLDVRKHYVGERQNGGVTPASQTEYNAFGLTYEWELGLPRVGTNNGFQIEPDLAPNYSKLRAYASQMTISSSTISGSNFNLAGTLSSGVIADTRDIAQIKGTNGAARAFPQAALYQQSVTRGDDLRAVTVAKGAVDLMGPDYPRSWTSPDQDGTDTISAEWKNFQLTGRVGPTTPVFTGNMSTLITGAGLVNVQQCWITPWKTDFWVSDTSNPGNAPSQHKVVYTPEDLGLGLHESGIFDIDAYVQASLITAAPADQLTLYEADVFANFIHVFARIEADGLVHYSMKSEVQKNTIRSLDAWHRVVTGKSTAGAASGTTASATDVNFGRHCFRSRPRMMRSGMATADGGKYLGTLLNISVGGIYAPGNNVFSIYFGDTEVKVRARNVDAPGRVGPAHIIRYDGVSIDQQMQFQGTTLIQGVAQGRLAPFVSTTPQAITIPDSLFSKFIDILWARSPHFKRICTLQEYDQKIRPFFNNLTAAKLMEIIDRLDDGDRDLMYSIGQAAGLFNGKSAALSSSGSKALQTAGMQYPGVADNYGGRYLDLSGSSNAGVRRQR